MSQSWYAERLQNDGPLPPEDEDCRYVEDVHGKSEILCEIVGTDYHVDVVVWLDVFLCWASHNYVTTLLVSENPELTSRIAENESGDGGAVGR